MTSRPAVRGGATLLLVGAAGSVALAQTHTQARDTVITLDIGSRTWQRDSVTVGVRLQASGTARAPQATWRATVGVSALLGHVTVDLHDIRGRIHFKVDPSALDSIGRSTTPPAVPPRR